MDKGSVHKWTRAVSINGQGQCPKMDKGSVEWTETVSINGQEQCPKMDKGSVHEWTIITNQAQFSVVQACQCVHTQLKALQRSMAEHKRQRRAAVRSEECAAAFTRDGYVVLDAPARNVRLTDQDIEGLEREYMAEFAGANQVDRGRKMHSFQPPYDEFGHPSEGGAEGLNARHLSDCFDVFCTHVGLPRGSTPWIVRRCCGR
jgi:hypothetical protein